MTRPRWCSALLFALAVACCAPAAAQEEGDPTWQPGTATHLYGLHGLTGGGTMVDGQLPTPLLAAPPVGSPGPLGTSSLRFGLRLDGARQVRRYRGVLGRYRVTREHRGLTAVHGLTVRGLDLAVTAPYRFASERLELRGTPGRASDGGESLGEVTLAAKVGLRVPKFFFGDWAIAGVGFYAVGRLDTRLPASQPDSAEYGFAVTGPYGYGVRYVGNLAIRHEAGGAFALVWRAGASVVPLADEDLVVRVFGHFSGVEHEGMGLPTVDLELGAQALIAGWLVVTADASCRLVETSRVEPPLARGLRASGERIQTTAGEGAFSLAIGVGVLL